LEGAAPAAAAGTGTTGAASFGSKAKEFLSTPGGAASAGFLGGSLTKKKSLDRVQKQGPAAFAGLSRTAAGANAALERAVGKTGAQAVKGIGMQTAITEGTRKVQQKLHPDENKMMKGKAGALAGGAIGNVAGRYISENPKLLDYNVPKHATTLTTLGGAGLGSAAQDYFVGKKKKKKLLPSLSDEAESAPDSPEVMEEEEEVKSMKKSIKKSSLQKSIDSAVDNAFKKATNVISGDTEIASIKPGKKTASGAQMCDSSDNVYSTGAKPIPVSKCVNEFDNTAASMNRKYSSEVNTKRGKINSGTLQGPKKVKSAGVKTTQIRKDVAGDIQSVGSGVKDAAIQGVKEQSAGAAKRIGAGMAGAASKLSPGKAAALGAAAGALTAPKGKKMKRALTGAALGYGAKLAYDKWGKPAATTPATTPSIPEGAKEAWGGSAAQEEVPTPKTTQKIDLEQKMPGGMVYAKSMKKSVKKSAPISSYPAQQQQAVINRRIEQPGLGGVSARDAQKIIDAQTKAQALKTLGVSKAVDTYTTNSVPKKSGSTTKGIKCKTCGSTDMADNGRHFTCGNCSNSFKKSFLTPENSVLTSTQKKTVRDSKNYHEEITDNLTRKRPEMEQSELDMAKSQASLRVEKAILFLNGYEPMGDDNVKKSFHGQIPEIMSDIETRPPFDWWEKAIKKASVFTEDPISYATNLWYDINKAVAEPIEGKFNPYRKGEENQINDGTRLDVSDVAGKGKSEITTTL
jgi:hypothetical protein